MSENTTMHGVHARDLGVSELWEASLLRSRHRREIFDDIRKRRTRRKAGSLALSASMLGGTVAPAIAAATTSTGTADGRHGEANAADRRRPRAPSSSSVGSTGSTVASVQAKLRSTLPGIWVDGIYGPQTESAVRAFQRAHGLPVSGQVDARTWSALFRSGVTFLDGRTAAAEGRRGQGAAEAAALRHGGSASTQQADVQTTADTPHGRLRGRSPTRRPTADTSDAGRRRRTATVDHGRPRAGAKAPDDAARRPRRSRSPPRAAARAAPAGVTRPSRADHRHVRRVAPRPPARRPRHRRRRRARRSARPSAAR